MPELSIRFECHTTGLEEIKRRRSTTWTTRRNFVCTARQLARESKLKGSSSIGTLFLACAQALIVAPQPFKFDSLTCFLHKRRLSWVISGARKLLFQRGLVSIYVINGQPVPARFLIASAGSGQACPTYGHTAQAAHTCLGLETLRRRD
jgi:hypothetical protein